MTAAEEAGGALWLSLLDWFLIPQLYLVAARDAALWSIALG